MGEYFENYPNNVYFSCYSGFVPKQGNGEKKPLFYLNYVMFDGNLADEKEHKLKFFAEDV